MNKLLTVLIVSFLMVGCEHVSQTRYGYSEVGQIQNTEWGTVINVRDIDIIAENSELGATVGAVAGGVTGASQMGGGYGKIVTGTVGAAVGGVVGSALEQAIRNRGGVEYTVVLRNGKTITVAQNVSAKDVILRVNDRVLVQINGTYQRVLPANTLPTEINRPKGIEFKDEKVK